MVGNQAKRNGIRQGTYPGRHGKQTGYVVKTVVKRGGNNRPAFYFQSLSVHWYPIPRVICEVILNHPATIVISQRTGVFAFMLQGAKRYILIH